MKILEHKSDLNESFEVAFDNNYEFIAVMVYNGKGNELIINERRNFEDKLDYYNSAYDLSLEHRHADNIKITGIILGNSLSEIEYKMNISELEA